MSVAFSLAVAPVARSTRQQDRILRSDVELMVASVVLSSGVQRTSVHVRGGGCIGKIVVDGYADV